MVTRGLSVYFAYPQEPLVYVIVCCTTLVVYMILS